MADITSLGSESAVSAATVTPHDTNELAAGVRALYIGVSGDLVVDMKEAGAIITFKSVPVGILPIRPLRVRATNTTATDIVALY